MAKDKEKESPKIESIHTKSENCNCSCCLENRAENRKKYVQILDVDRYINSLNDWD